jgi:hypothetical protein
MAERCGYVNNPVFLGNNGPSPDAPSLTANMQFFILKLKMAGTSVLLV